MANTTKRPLTTHNSIRCYHLLQELAHTPDTHCCVQRMEFSSPHKAGKQAKKISATTTEGVITISIIVIVHSRGLDAVPVPNPRRSCSFHRFFGHPTFHLPCSLYFSASIATSFTEVWTWAKHTHRKILFHISASNTQIQVCCGSHTIQDLREL